MNDEEEGSQSGCPDLFHWWRWKNCPSGLPSLTHSDSQLWPPQMFLFGESVPEPEIHEQIPPADRVFRWVLPYGSAGCHDRRRWSPVGFLPVISRKWDIHSGEGMDEPRGWYFLRFWEIRDPYEIRPEACSFLPSGWSGQGLQNLRLLE